MTDQLFMKYIFTILIMVNFTCMSNKCMDSDTLSRQARNELLAVLNEQEKFIKVHAAEFLLWMGLDKEKVKQEFLKENEKFENEPKYRIGIWRVLAQASVDENEKIGWTEKIMNVFVDTTAPDRIHAAETLAKLKISPLTKFPDVTNRTLNDTNNMLSVYTRWAVSYTSDSEEEKYKKEFIHDLFNNSDTVIRKISAYVLSKSKNLTDGEWKDLAEKALAEPATSPLKQTLLNTAFVTYTGHDKTKSDSVKKELLMEYERSNAEQRIALSQSLADKGTCSDLAVPKSFINNENAAALYDVNSPLAADVRAFAAYAILDIIKRN